MSACEKDTVYKHQSQLDLNQQSSADLDSHSDQRRVQSQPDVDVFNGGAREFSQIKEQLRREHRWRIKKKKKALYSVTINISRP